jgi:hypothetical protein
VLVKPPSIQRTGIKCASYQNYSIDGARPGVGEAAKHTENRNKVCVLSKLFKARNTGIRETHEIQWEKGEGVDVYTLSDTTYAEYVTHERKPFGYGNLEGAYV